MPKRPRIGVTSVCKLPPEGWWCAIEAGHEGPCAARQFPAKTEREELAAVILEELGWDWPGVATERIPSARDVGLEVADVILAAGWSRTQPSEPES